MQKYIKVGGGSMRVNCNGTIIKLKSKEVFDETIYQHIPESFKDLVQPYNGNVAATSLSTVKQPVIPIQRKTVAKSGNVVTMQRTKPQETPAPATEPAVESTSKENNSNTADSGENAGEGRYVKISGGGGWFNIIDTLTGKKMNETALRDADAESLLATLQEGLSNVENT